jgi:Protein of unknown function (DUF3293)
LIEFTKMTTTQPNRLDWKMQSSEIDLATIEAYHATHYTVLTPEPFVLRVGEVSSRMADILANQKVSCAAFLTAWNPFSRRATEAENAVAQQTLLAELSAVGRRTIPGFGKDPSGLWPGEDSVLVLDLSFKQACNLGLKYSQNAILWVGPNACPELVLLR